MALTRTLRRNAPHLFWLSLYASLILSWIWRDQLAYRASDVDANSILAGIGCAPEQYRIAAPRLAHFLQLHLHLHSIIAGSILIDLFGSLLLCVLLYRLLLRRLTTSPLAVQLCAKALLGLLIFFYLHWSYLSARVDTIPCCLYVVLALLLLDRAQRTAFTPTTLLYTTAFVLLSFLQGWVRADVSVIFATGVCAAALFPLANTSRPAQLFFAVEGFIAALFAGAALLYLMRHVYPNAHYCGGVLALRFNFGEPYAFIPFLTLMPPIVWGLAALTRRWRKLSLSDRSLLLATLAYIPIWTTVGSWGEARIIAPFALALTPTIALSMATWLATPTPSPQP